MKNILVKNIFYFQINVARFVFAISKNESGDS